MKPEHLQPVTRRRALFIGATLAAGAAASRAFAAGVVRWSGQALGAHAQIELTGVSTDAARPVFHAVESEIARLEGIFSLFRTDSALVRLNRGGRLSDPPPELLEVLAMAGTAHAETGGLFDPTVQPLFAFYADFFTRRHRRKTPDQAMRDAALALVGFDAVAFDVKEVVYRKPGMAMTLNGIAQGYITDRIAALLRQRGFADMLLDIGEIRAVGHGLDGNGWRVGLKTAPGSDAIGERLRLADEAVATSMMLGTTFDEGGTAGHILHPKRGLVTHYRQRASVVDPSAAHADALSTAVILMTDDQVASMRARGARVYT